MAEGTIGRELRSGVVGVSRLGIIRRMATVAGVGRAVVIAVVAGSTVIGNGCMSAVQRIIVAVNRERSRLPTRCGRMAHRTISREAERYVVRVGGLVEIRRVATITGVWRIGEIAVVTGVAVVGNGNMGSCKRINGVVIKSRGRPGCFRVA
mgnify:FL=1